MVNFILWEFLKVNINKIVFFCLKFKKFLRRVFNVIFLNIFIVLKLDIMLIIFFDYFIILEY